jgi:hypothetical protein
MAGQRHVAASLRDRAWRSGSPGRVLGKAIREVTDATCATAGEGLTCELTTPDVGDMTAVPDLLNQITTPFETFMGDGAYDGEPVAQAVLTKQPDAQATIPPHKSAVLSATRSGKQSCQSFDGKDVNTGWEVALIRIIIYYSMTYMILKVKLPTRLPGSKNVNIRTGCRSFNVKNSRNRPTSAA